MRWVLVVAATVCLLGGAVLMEAPATLVDARVDALTQGRLRVADASGTVWNGSGTLVLLPYAARIPLRWRIDALPLLGARLSGTLASDTPGIPEATFDLGSDRFAVHHLAAAAPAEALLLTGGAPSVITRAGGLVEVRADDFGLRGGAFDGGFVVRWQDASVPSLRSDVRYALGDVRLDATGAGAEVRAALSNTGGDIEVSGALMLNANGTMRVDARLKPRPGINVDRSKSITTALSMIGAPDESGGFRVLWQGRR